MCHVCAYAHITHTFMYICIHGKPGSHTMVAIGPSIRHLEAPHPLRCTPPCLRAIHLPEMTMPRSCSRVALRAARAIPAADSGKTCSSSSSFFFFFFFFCGYPWRLDLMITPHSQHSQQQRAPAPLPQNSSDAAQQLHRGEHAC